MRTNINILISWALSILVFIINAICIIRPVVWVGVLEDTYIQGLIVFPLYAIALLGPFILIYVSVRNKEYKTESYFTSLLYHVVSCITFYLIISFIAGGDGKFSFFEWTNTLLSIILYMAFHVFLMRFFIRKLRL